MTWTARFFRPGEFDSPDSPGSGKNMNLAFVTKLDKVRELIHEPMVVSSGYRTKAHNAKVGGVPDSAHLKGLAADIKVKDAGMVLSIVAAALMAGIRRIGVGETLVHLDDDPSLPQNVMWPYKDK